MDASYVMQHEASIAGHLQQADRTRALCRRRYVSRRTWHSVRSCDQAALAKHDLARLRALKRGQAQ